MSIITSVYTQFNLFVFFSSFLVIHSQVAQQNHAAVYNKLKLMATVHQTQPTIQLLLSTSDFVGALDLISTTQEVVQQELMSIHCFRYLSSQLKEMENLIEKMLSTEFERLTTAELNRPLQENVLVTEEDRLTAVISGMLRQRRYNFIELFKGNSNKKSLLCSISIYIYLHYRRSINSYESLNEASHCGSVSDK